MVAEAIDELDREVPVQSGTVRARQHTADARRTGTTASPEGADGSRDGPNQPDDHSIGRSRGGPTTRIHLACDGHARPLSIVLTGGNVNDCTQAMASIEFSRPGPHASSRTRTTRPRPTAPLRARGIPATIPQRRDQHVNRKHQSRAGGRPPTFDRTAFTRRTVVERRFNRLRQFRAIATRFDKTAVSYRGMTDLATLLI